MHLVMAMQLVANTRLLLAFPWRGTTSPRYRGLLMPRCAHLRIRKLQQTPLVCGGCHLQQTKGVPATVPDSMSVPIGLVNLVART